VLDATVSLLEESYMVTVSDIAGRTGLETATVAKALEALDPDFVDFRKTTTGGDPTFWYVLKVTPQARSAVGQWPTPDSFVTKLSAELSAAASHEEDAERRSLLSYAARLIGDTLREAAVRAAGQVLAPAMGPALASSASSKPVHDEPLPLAEAARAAASSSGTHSSPAPGPQSSPSGGHASPSSEPQPAPSGDKSSSSGSESPQSPGLRPLPSSGGQSSSSGGESSQWPGLRSLPSPGSESQQSPQVPPLPSSGDEPSSSPGSESPQAPELRPLPLSGPHSSSAAGPRPASHATAGRGTSTPPAS
jgi:hypothetical protein